MLNGSRLAAQRSDVLRPVVDFLIAAVTNLVFHIAFFVAGCRIAEVLKQNPDLAGQILKNLLLQTAYAQPNTTVTG